MKHDHNHDNARSAGHQLMPARFAYTYLTTTVCITGTFLASWKHDPAFLRRW